MQENYVKLRSPLERIIWLSPDELTANDYNPNHVLPEEMALLEYSMEKHGWIQPIIISSDNVIIDGFHRWTISKKKGWYVPCVIDDMDINERMLLTIRINRAKGSHASIKMSDIIKRLIANGLSKEYIAKSIGATLFEVNLLLEDAVYNKKQLEEREYSQSWNPKKK